MRSALSKDFLASIVVFLVALPLCMGVAIASGMPPAAGLITGIVGGTIVGLLSGAPLQVSGPAAGLTVLVFEIVRTHGVAMLGPIVLVAGAIQLMAGWLKMGQWFRAVSPAVIHGMLGGIGVLIFASQFHIMLDGTPEGNGLSNLAAIPSTIWRLVSSGGTSVHAAAALVGLLTIVLMAGWDLIKRNPLRIVPAPLFAVLAGTLVTYLAGLPIQRVSIPDSLAGAISWPTLASLSRLLEPAMLVSIVSVALIASAETLLCASALGKMRADAEVKYDKELAAQGLGNMLCGLLGALPMTGVIVRSTANIRAGARTRLSPILHGVWLLLLVCLVPGLLRYVPMASLAAVLVFTGYKLVNPSIATELAKYGRGSLVTYLVTLVGIVCTDLLTGVLLGIGCSLLTLIRSLSRLRIDRREEHGVIELSLSGIATVFTLPKLAEAIERVPRETPIRVDVSRLLYVDHACMDLLDTARAQRKGTIGTLTVTPSGIRRKYFRSQREADTTFALRRAHDSQATAAVALAAPRTRN